MLTPTHTAPVPAATTTPGRTAEKGSATIVLIPNIDLATSNGTEVHPDEDTSRGQVSEATENTLHEPSTDGTRENDSCAVLCTAPVVNLCQCQ